MFRFFADIKNGDSFDLSSETLKHIKVARATKEEFIVVHQENFYICHLVDQSAKIISQLNESHEHEGEVILAASFINVKRFEWLVQKATELGATKLIPIMSKNISTKIPRDIKLKIDRWNLIARNASEQSFRNKAMKVEMPMTFKEALEIKIDHKYIAYTQENSKQTKSFPTNSIFFIGPEGGFTQEEIKDAKDNGVEVISLGKRILRAETASIYVLARIN